MEDSKEPILYVVVVGFHHKRGCQVEFSYPPLLPDNPNECPAGWKYLPTLALPDGSHKYEEDTVFFHLPSLNQPRKTVYGISCYRQIPVEKLKNRTADITRGTVQKSVCVLSKIPLYGHIQVKMELITHAYFDEGDFSKVSLLQDTYHHLNSVLTQSDISAQIYVGLSPRDFIFQWRHKAVLLFKLVLLEKRVVFHKSPVHPLCSTILSLLSLFPAMIENGLDKSACVRLSRPMSPMPLYSDDESRDSSPQHISSETKLDLSPSSTKPSICNIKKVSMTVSESEECLTNGNNKANVEENNLMMCKQIIDNGSEIGLELTENTDANLHGESISTKDDERKLCRELSTEVFSDTSASNMTYLAQIKNESCGFPLGIFQQGYLCLPYLSLPYMDLLSDVNVRGYVVGATNVLFKQKRQLYDVLVDIDGGRIECHDMELRKQLHLTTEDLRFVDYIVKHVSEEKHDIFLDGVGWEGGDEWIRMQFKIYLLCLMKTSLLQDGCREFDHFNSSFVYAWKDTYNYKLWNSMDCPNILEVNPGHPFAGQLSVSDMKLRLSHTMQNTEGGRRINQAMASTGRAVATTSKAVGGALSQAKGAFSNWWSNLLVSPEPMPKSIDTVVYQEEDTIDNKLIKDDDKVIRNGFIKVSTHDENNTVNTSSQNINSHNNSSDIQVI